MAQPRNKLGYAKLAPYQYHTLNPQAIQYGYSPVFSQPPPPPKLEPPTNHPVEKDPEDEEEEAKAEEPVAGGEEGEAAVG